MAEVVVLGSGTSNGVPALCKTYSVEFLSNPKNHRLRPAIVFVGPEGNVLVDCPPELRLQLLREGVDSLCAVVITHTHADHVMGMDDLRSFSMSSGTALPVYAFPKYQDDIRRIFAYAFEDAAPGIFVPRFSLHDLPSRASLGGLEFEFLTVKHGRIDVAAMRVGNFAYVTDVSEIPPPAWERLSGLDTLVLDAVRHRPHPNHYHLERAIEVAQSLGARQTFFTHLCDEFDHDVVESGLPKGIRLAYDGLRVPLEPVG